MTNAIPLRCDGCGQVVEPAHIARRLQRLEWATRFRPVHIQTLLLGGASPGRDDEFLYCPELPIEGEARNILQAAQVSIEGRSREAILTEFQKLGLMLTHVLECPLAEGVSADEARAAMQSHLPAVIARIRRSLKPKRVFLVSGQLGEFAERLRQADLGCPVLPAPTGTFLQSLSPAEPEWQALRAALADAHA